MIYNFVIPNNINDVMAIYSTNTNTNNFELMLECWDGNAILKFDRKLTNDDIDIVNKLVKAYESFPEENSIESSNPNIIKNLISLGCISFIILIA